MRDAAQILVARDGFGLDPRACYGCNRTERLLVGEKPEKQVTPRRPPHLTYNRRL